LGLYTESELAAGSPQETGAEINNMASPRKPLHSKILRRALRTAVSK